MNFSKSGKLFNYSGFLRKRKKISHLKLNTTSKGGLGSDVTEHFTLSQS